MAAIRLPADETISVLEPHWEQLLSRGISRLSLLGMSKSPTMGPLAKHLSYPAVHFYLDPKPPEATEAIVTKGKLQWVSEEPSDSESCVFWVSNDTDIQSLFDIGQNWSRPNTSCNDRLFLVIGQRPASAKWFPPIPCPQQFRREMAIDDKTE